MRKTTYKEFCEQWDKWLEDCCQELAKKGYDPENWEISEDGTVYYLYDCIYIKNAVTPWKDSIHYVE